MQERQLDSLENNIDKLSKELEKFYSQWQNELFQLYAGFKTTSNLGNIYHAYESIFSAETIQKIKSWQEDLRDSEKLRRLEHLKKLVIGGYMELAGKRLLEHLINTESTSSVDVEGEKIPYKTALYKLTQERDKLRRRLLFEALAPISARLEMLRREQLQTMSKAAHQAGYRSLSALFREVGGIDLSHILRLAETTAGRLEALFKKSMEQISLLMLESHSHELAEWDLPYLLKGELFDGYFPEQRFLAGFWTLNSEMGIPLSNRKNLQLDTEPRKGKGTMASLFPIRIPNQLILVIFPREGYKAYERLYQEGGRTLYYMHIKETLPFEFKASGDGALSEGYGLLFESILGNPKWWTTIMGGEIPPYLKEYRALIKLFLFFDSIGSALADEYLLGNWDDPDPLDGYAKIREKWRGIPFSKNQTYFNCELFRSAWRIRALLFEAQLRSYIVSRFGNDWFTHKGTSDFLRKLWGKGTSFKSEEILNELGFSNLDPQFFIKEITSDLRRYS